jgi:beta-lactamase regulating signal transducer with metallopeptidase domain
MTMAAWLQHDWCSSFVLALGHFLWQGTLIALVLAIALRAVKAVSMRYWLSLAALLLMAACPAVTLGWLLQPARHVATLDPLPVAREEPAPSQPMIPAETVEAASDVGHVSNVPVNPPIAPLDFNTSATISPPTPADDRSWWQKFAPQLTTAYLCGVALMLMRLVIGLWGGRRLRRQVRLIDEPSLLAAMQRQATALGLKLLPVLAYCERVTVPTVVGVLKPMILLPLTLTSGLSPEQMESVLAHELAHLRRYDHLVNLLQRVIESLLFSHPAMWWVSHRIREEREHCCDDLVVACGAMPLDYAKSLLVVAELSRASQLRRSVAAVSLLATGDKPSNLRQRIARLLGESATPSLRLSPRVLAMSVTVLLIELGMSNEQSSSDRDDERESVPAIANLPDGIAVELVGLTEMSAGETSWWKPNGDILTPSPKLAPQQSGTWKIGDIELRRVLIHVRGFKKDSMAVTANMSGSHVIEQLPSGESFLSWAGALQRPPAKRPTVVRVGVATEPLSPTRVLEANGQRRPRPADAPLDHIAEDIIVTKVRRLEGGKKQVAGKFVPIIETEVIYEMPAAWRQVDLQIVAIDKTGQTHHTSGGGGNLRDDANSKSPGQATGLAMFPLSPDEIDRFEYQFRLFRHWVTFENAAWNSEEHRKVRVITDSLPSPDNQKNGAGRGSPEFGRRNGSDEQRQRRPAVQPCGEVGRPAPSAGW